MANGSIRDDLPSFSNPSSSPILVSDAAADSFFGDQSSQISSASGSLQNEGLLSAAGGDGGSDVEFGFLRPDFRQALLVGSVQMYERHVFLCYKNPQVWPPHVEAAEFDRLPRLLSAAMAARKGEMKKQVIPSLPFKSSHFAVWLFWPCFCDLESLDFVPEMFGTCERSERTWIDAAKKDLRTYGLNVETTRLTICEGHDGTETSNGDVLIFPDMIRYRGLTHFDVDTFVEEVLVKDTEWLPGTPEALVGSYVFVCSHGSRDRRYGYVTPNDVPTLLEQHIGRGEIVDLLWRGQMGLSEEDQKKAQELRLQLSGKTSGERDGKEFTQAIHVNRSENKTQVDAVGCCQGAGTSSCCQAPILDEKILSNGINEDEVKILERKSEKKSKSSSAKGSCTRKACAMPTWFESWEREDTYAIVAVVAAAASVAIAYSCYKRLR
ncbi:hypothetical protein ACLOJK_041691 [Asimina triloba]